MTKSGRRLVERPDNPKQHAADQYEDDQVVDRVKRQHEDGHAEQKITDALVAGRERDDHDPEQDRGDEAILPRRMKFKLHTHGPPL